MMSFTGGETVRGSGRAVPHGQWSTVPGDLGQERGVWGIRGGRVGIKQVASEVGHFLGGPTGPVFWGEVSSLQLRWRAVVGAGSVSWT